MLLVFQLFNSEQQTLASLSRFGLGFFFLFPFQAFLFPLTSLLGLLDSSFSRVGQALLFNIDFLLEENLIIKLPVPFVDEGELLHSGCIVLVSIP